MVEERVDARLLDEHLDEIGRLRPLGQDSLDDERPLKSLHPGHHRPKHLRHSARPDPIEKDVTTEFLRLDLERVHLPPRSSSTWERRGLSRDSDSGNFPPQTSSRLRVPRRELAGAWAATDLHRRVSDADVARRGRGARQEGRANQHGAAPRDRRPRALLRRRPDELPLRRGARSGARRCDADRRRDADRRCGAARRRGSLPLRRAVARRDDRVRAPVRLARWRGGFVGAGCTSSTPPAPAPARYASRSCSGSIAASSARACTPGAADTATELSRWKRERNLPAAWTLLPRPRDDAAVCRQAADSDPRHGRRRLHFPRQPHRAATSEGRIWVKSRVSSRVLARPRPRHQTAPKSPHPYVSCVRPAE